MSLQNAKELAEENVQTNSTAQKTTIRHDTNVVNQLKEFVGVSQNKQVAPLADYVIADYLSEHVDDAERSERLQELAEEAMADFEELVDSE